uniref:PTTG1 interacting protein n=1 Tax=Amphilophus citrinellus TaxID=61819 RepID=A0A3Q0RY33_AMPCI
QPPRKGLCQGNHNLHVCVVCLLQCLWCFATNNCTEYPVSWLLPPATLCPLSQARWGVCWMNFEALIIAMAVLGGAILIGIVVCCCCCCCCRKSRPSRSAKRREEIKQSQLEQVGNVSSRSERCLLQ